MINDQALYIRGVYDGWPTSTSLIKHNHKSWLLLLHSHPFGFLMDVRTLPNEMYVNKLWCKTQSNKRSLYNHLEDRISSRVLFKYTSIERTPELKPSASLSGTIRVFFPAEALSEFE